MHRSVQLPLELGHSAGTSRDDLIVGPSNAQAVALIESWPDWPAPVLVLAGPPGAGKTHLAAIWREASAAAVLDPGRLGREAIAAAAAGPVLVDDVDRGHLDEPGLFHLINQVRTAGTFLLMTARRFPLGWGARLPDLVSRLKAVTTVEIAEPDDMLLSAVVTKLFADRQVQVEPHVVAYVVRRMERSLSAANRLVDALDGAALEEKSRITRVLARRVLDAHETPQSDFGF